MRVVFGLQASSVYPDRVRMLARLSRLVDRVWLLTDTAPGIEDLSQDYPDFKVVILPRKRFSSNALDWLISNENHLDIVHDAMGCFASYFQSRGPDADRRVRLISTLYTNNWAWFRRARAPWMDLSLAYVGQRVRTLWRDRRISRNADRMLVLGPGHEDDLVAAHDIPIERVAWIPSEINTERFQPSEDGDSQRRSILFTGAICRNKGIDTLLSACTILMRRGVDFELRLVGRILLWERVWFKGACAQADLGSRLHMTGTLGYEALLNEYQTAGVFAFPSRFEGSPRSVREALACHTPAVVSEIPGHRGIDPEGQFLHFVAGHEPEEWADVLGAAMDEARAPYQARCERGLNHMQTRHSLDAVAQILAETYRDVSAAPPWAQ